jgi:hypothetical protein
VSYRGDEAKAIVAATDKEDWGGDDKPIVKVTLKRKDDAWHAESFQVVSSRRFNKDGMTFPPYQ